MLDLLSDFSLRNLANDGHFFITYTSSHKMLYYSLGNRWRDFYEIPEILLSLKSVHAHTHKHTCLFNKNWCICCSLIPEYLLCQVHWVPPGCLAESQTLTMPKKYLFTDVTDRGPYTMSEQAFREQLQVEHLLHCPSLQNVGPPNLDPLFDWLLPAKTISPTVGWWLCFLSLVYIVDMGNSRVEPQSSTPSQPIDLGRIPVSQLALWKAYCDR